MVKELNIKKQEFVKTRNFKIEESSGKYFMFVDSGDYILFEWFRNFSKMKKIF